MMKSIVALLIVNLVLVAKSSASALQAQTASSFDYKWRNDKFLVKDINYNNLISGELPSDIQANVLEILQQDGIIALSGMPGLAEAREDAFVASATCVFEKHSSTKLAPLELTLEDGSTRYSWGALAGSIAMPLSPACPDLQQKMETLRNLVNRGARAFGRLLDKTVLFKEFDQGLFSNTEGLKYSSFEQVISQGKHLDHFHVYQNNDHDHHLIIKKRTRTLELHTDQGLFIGFIPSIQVSRNGLLLKSEDRLVIDVPSKGQVNVDFPHDGNVLVFMIGEGINLVKKYSIRSLRPVPHALESASGSFDKAQQNLLRAWFGRMFFPPSDVVVPTLTGKETFESFMARIRNASTIEDSPDNNNSILSLACDHSKKANDMALQRRMLQDATGNDCSAEEVYCWMSCLPINALPCSKDSIICQKQNGEIWEPCDTCHDPSSKLVCTTSAPTPPPVVHREFDVSLGLLHLWFSANGTHAKFRLEGSERGYIGFGLGSIMISSLAVIGMDPTANSQDAPVGIYRIVDLVGTRDKLAVTPAQLSSFGIVDSSFKLVPGGSELEFTVDPTKQNPQFPIIGDKVDIIYAQGPLLYEEHYAFGNKRSMNFSTGASSSNSTTGNPDDNSEDDGVDGYYLVNPTLAAHIVLMTIAWGVFAPIGVLFPLFNNKSKFGLGSFVSKWFTYHWVGQSVAVILGYVGTLLGYLSVESKRKPHWNTSHQIIGLVVLLLSIIQPLTGHFRPHKPSQEKTPSDTSNARKAFEIIHPLLGYSLLFLAMANTLTGVPELYETSGRQAFYSFTKGGPLMATEFSGPLGVIVICLFALFSSFIVIGWSRIILRGKRPRTDKTSPATAPPPPAMAPASPSDEEQSEPSSAELIKADSFTALAQD